jgi:CRP-like cAMP-binding protein
MNVSHERLGFTNSTSFWDRLEDEEQRLLRDIAELVIYAPRERLITVGHFADTAMVIQTGWAKITNIYPGSNADAMWLRTSGDLVGESASVRRPRIATVTAINEVRALVVTAKHFTEFLQNSTNAQRALQETQCDRQIESDRKCIELGQTNASQRLAGLLLRLFDRAGHIEGEAGARKICLDLPLSQREFGQLIRASCSTVERTLQDWRRRGFIITDHRRLTLLSESELRRIAVPDGTELAPDRTT